MLNQINVGLMAEGNKSKVKGAICTGAGALSLFFGLVVFKNTKIDNIESIFVLMGLGLVFIGIYLLLRD